MILQNKSTTSTQQRRFSSIWNELLSSASNSESLWFRKHCGRPNLLRQLSLHLLAKLLQTRRNLPHLLYLAQWRLSSQYRIGSRWHFFQLGPFTIGPLNQHHRNYTSLGDISFNWSFPAGRSVQDPSTEQAFKPLKFGGELEVVSSAWVLLIFQADRDSKCTREFHARIKSFS
jgi:hypothetical protein